MSSSHAKLLLKLHSRLWPFRRDNSIAVCTFSCLYMVASTGHSFQPIIQRITCGQRLLRSHLMVPASSCSYVWVPGNWILDLLYCHHKMLAADTNVQREYAFGALEIDKQGFATSLWRKFSNTEQPRGQLSGKCQVRSSESSKCLPSAHRATSCHILIAWGCWSTAVHLRGC